MRMLRSEIMIKWKDTLRVGVPAFAYVVQNQLLFLALSNLDAATYQVSHCSHPYTLTRSVCYLTRSVCHSTKSVIKLLPYHCTSLLLPYHITQGLRLPHYYQVSLLPYHTTVTIVTTHVISPRSGRLGRGASSVLYR